MGPMTGRGFGYCAGFNAPGYVRGGAGYGRGFGRGFTRGFGRGYGAGFGFRRALVNYPPYVNLPYQYPAPNYSESDELEMLRSQSKILKEQLDNIQKRIETN